MRDNCSSFHCSKICIVQNISGSSRPLQFKMKIPLFLCVINIFLIEHMLSHDLCDPDKCKMLCLSQNENVDSGNFDKESHVKSKCERRCGEDNFYNCYTDEGGIVDYFNEC